MSKGWERMILLKDRIKIQKKISRGREMGQINNVKC